MVPIIHWVFPTAMFLLIESNRLEIVMQTVIPLSQKPNSPQSLSCLLKSPSCLTNRSPHCAHAYKCLQRCHLADCSFKSLPASTQSTHVISIAIYNCSHLLSNFRLNLINSIFFVPLICLFWRLDTSFLLWYVALQSWQPFLLSCTRSQHFLSNLSWDCTWVPLSIIHCFYSQYTTNIILLFRPYASSPQLFYKSYSFLI